ncbi:MAG TPA: hypothetical protein VIL61_05150 [Nitrospiria bacterium]
MNRTDMNEKKSRPTVIMAALVLIAASLGLMVAVIQSNKPLRPTVGPQVYLSLFQLHQKQDFQKLHTELSALQPYGAVLERKFGVNPMPQTLAAADRRDQAGILLGLEQLVILDIQDRLATAEERFYASPEQAMDALHTARLNYQVLSLFAPQADTDLHEAVKTALLTTMISVKNESATPALLKTYTNEIQSKLRQMYPGVRLVMAVSSFQYN